MFCEGSPISVTRRPMLQFHHNASSPILDRKLRENRAEAAARDPAAGAEPAASENNPAGDVFSFDGLSELSTSADHAVADPAWDPLDYRNYRDPPPPAVPPGPGEPPESPPAPLPGPAPDLSLSAPPPLRDPRLPPEGTPHVRVIPIPVAPPRPPCQPPYWAQRIR